MCSVALGVPAVGQLHQLHHKHRNTIKQSFATQICSHTQRTQTMRMYICMYIDGTLNSSTHEQYTHWKMAVLSHSCSHNLLWSTLSQKMSHTLWRPSLQLRIYTKKQTHRNMYTTTYICVHIHRHCIISQHSILLLLCLPKDMYTHIHNKMESLWRPKI